MRDLIEDWFSNLCPDAQADVRGRLRSRDDRQFNGAFFELYLHQALLAMGYVVTCHPELEGTPRRPDFLAVKDGERVYIEARSASPSDIAIGSSARVNDIYESLDKLASPNFFVWIDVVKHGEKPLGTRPMRKALEAWLEGLDPDSVPTDDGAALDNLPTYVYRDKGWVIGFRAIPKSKKSRGRPGVRPLGVFGGGRAHIVHDDRDIREALSDKGKAYGELGTPFVVAVASGSPTLDNDDIVNVLYGTEVIELIPQADGYIDHQQTRKPDGYWYRGDHWAHQGVSAVLIVKNLHYAFVSTQQHTVWEHPDPDRTAPAFPLWRRATVEPGNPIAYADPDKTQGEWFGLPDPWPAGEAFPHE